MNFLHRTHTAVWALSVTAFAIGVAEFIVVGILPAIAFDLGIPLEKAGKLVGLYALALAMGTPIVVLILARLPRKKVLLGLVIMFLIGNLVTALSSSYEGLLLGRIITAVAHGGFFAIGATVAARLAHGSQASQAIAIMFAGLTLAMVVGVPLGSLIGNSLGWRLPFYAVAMLAFVAIVAIAIWVPDLPTQESGSTHTQLVALRQPEIMAMMATTILGFGSSFPAFTFISPILTNVTSFDQSTVSLLLVVFGLATLLGNLAGGWLSTRIGWVNALRCKLTGLSIILFGLSLLMNHQGAMVLIIFAWGAFAFGVSPSVQAGMLATANCWTPRAVDFASALNISAFNLGISLGETIGSVLVAREHLELTPWAGVVLAMLAQLPLSWLLQRHAQFISKEASAPI